MHYLYIIHSEKADRYYIGASSHPVQRLEAPSLPRRIGTELLSFFCFYKCQ
ncbi:hypothetical protein [Aquimarina brevivitae]|uniref:hypothetical protein n=1 Tax=Aquimarina brevivitae TaxID=323412 RepID=UPI003BF78B93